MSEFSITPQDLAQLARLVEENALSELRYEEEGGLRITLRTAAHVRAATAPTVAAVPIALSPAGVPLTTESELPSPYAAGEDENGCADEETSASGSDDDRLRIEAPIMGIFYRRPAQDQPSFIEVGDVIEAGQTIGIIEAMKVFSEIPSEVGGRVVAIPVQNGALVHPGDALVVLEAE